MTAALVQGICEATLASEMQGVFAHDFGVTDVNGIASVTATVLTVGSESVAVGYQSATGATFTLTGTRARLTFTATNVSVPPGQPIPPLHYSIAGFVNGDGPAVATGAPAEATTAQQGQRRENIPSPSLSAIWRLPTTVSSSCRAH
jgi:hypothetical protein